MGPQAKALTEQFYAWECRGRGWFVSDSPVELEPAFEPFWEHFVSNEIIDDAKRPSWWQSICAPSPSQKTSEVQAAPAKTFPDAFTTDLTVFSVTVPKAGKQSAEHMEQLLTLLSYHSAITTMEIVGSASRICMQWTCREPDTAFVYTQLKSFFPEVQIIQSEDDHLFSMIEDAPYLYTVDFGLQEECMRPIATGVSVDHDPYTALFGVMEHLAENQHIAMQLLVSGTRNAWAESMYNAACDESKARSFFIDAPEMPTLTKEKTARPLCAVAVRLVTSSTSAAEAQQLLQHGTVALVHASTSPFNALAPLPESHNTPTYPIERRVSDLVLRQSHRTGMLLNTREVVRLWHYPSPALKTPRVIHSTRTTKAAPVWTHNEAYTIGINEHQGVSIAVGIPELERLRHIHIMGATGTGKSTLLHSLIMHDIHAGDGCMVLDPHGDLISAILSNLPQSRIADVLIIDPSDSEYPIGFNILSAHSELEKELLASDLVMVLKRFSTSWGDQMHSVLANAILALLYNTTVYHIGDLRRFLIEAAFRTTVLSSVTDEHIVYYWQKEFPLLKGGSIGSLLTRLDSFLRPKAIRAMLCQTKGLDMATLMDTRKIILVKLSQGLIGAENSYLLGAFIVSKLQQTALARQTQSASARIPFYCYIDEFQYFVTPSMSAILSGARKFGLGLVLAHQNMQQVMSIDADIANSVLANAGTRICFRLGDTDAKRMQEGFATFSADDFQNLQVGDAIARVNTADCDFSLSMSRYIPDTAEDNTAAIIAHARTLYSAPIPERVSIPPTDMLPKPGTPLLISAPQPGSDTASKEPVREHRYIQAYVKKMAESYGYRASIEVPTPTGDGLIDVLLEKDDATIAVEVSVTTRAAWELHNVRKCLVAGYGRIVVCTDQPSKRKAIQSAITEQLPQRDQAKITVLASTDIHTLFMPLTAGAPSETVHKGYRVKVQYEQSANRDNLIQSIVNVTRKPL